MSEKLAGRVVVVAGGSRGLGFAIASLFASEGARVVVASRSKSSVAKAVEDLRARGAMASGMVCDVTDLAKVEALSAFALRAFGRIDLWVNAASVSAPLGPSAHLDSSRFTAVLQTNILGTYNGSIVALRHMAQEGQGKIINLLGCGDPEGFGPHNAATSSKAWIRKFTKSLASEYRPSGVGIFALDPGLVVEDRGRRIDALEGFEPGLGQLSLVCELWGAQPGLAAHKALWLAGSATDGWTGRVARVLSPGYVLGHLWLGLVRRLAGKKSLAPEVAVDRLAPVPPFAQAQGLPARGQARIA